MKISSWSKPNPLHFSYRHKVPRRKMFVFQRDTSSGKSQLKTTNVQKTYSSFTNMCALFVILHLNTNAHKLDHHSPCIVQTLVMFKKGKKMQYQYK